MSSSEVRLLREAMSLHQQARLAEAAAQYERVIRKNPRNPDALHYLGVLKGSQGRLQEAKALIERSLAAKPVKAPYLENYVTILFQTGEYEKAVEAIETMPRVPPQTEMLEYQLSISLHKLGRFAEAVKAFDHLIARNPNNLVAKNEKAASLAELGAYDEALACIEEALTINPMYLEAWLNKGNVLHRLNRSEEAATCYERVVRTNPPLPDAFLAYGHVLRALNRPYEATAAFDKAIRLKPDLADAWLGRGNALTESRVFRDAIAAFDKALSLAPHLAPAWLGRGKVCTELKRFGDALAAYESALRLKPDLAEAWLGRGTVYSTLKQYADAFTAFDKAFALAPDLARVESYRLHAKMHLCDWTDFAFERDRLVASVASGKKSADPLVMLGIHASTADELTCAAVLTERHRPGAAISPHKLPSHAHERLRIGYLSIDFREHAVAHLLAEVFERHDRSRFEVYGFALCPEDRSPMQLRLKSAFEHFVFVHDKSADEIVGTIRRGEIDILVDLMGFTQGSVPQVITARAAPLQVTYLSYPGISGSSGIDYMIADRTVLTESDRAIYDKAVVTLPNSYITYDTKSEISTHTPNRNQEGLPDSGFVFCCFNHTFKITPDVFDEWMRILHGVEGSVLWLASTNDVAKENLRSRAASAGIAPDRLRFAAFCPERSDHLARHRLADLFLDTLPFNAHTTALDALWAGTPVLTRLGSSFCGRVAASLLRALDLPELITNSAEEYKSRAIELALAPDKLLAIRTKLEQTSRSRPPFDGAAHASHLEAAYQMIYERYRQGLRPAHIDVSA